MFFQEARLCSGPNDDSMSDQKESLLVAHTYTVPKETLLLGYLKLNTSFISYKNVIDE